MSLQGVRGMDGQVGPKGNLVSYILYRLGAQHNVNTMSCSTCSHLEICLRLRARKVSQALPDSKEPQARRVCLDHRVQWVLQESR